MYNIFRELAKAAKNASSENKPYWESDNNTFGTTIGPDGNYYNEEELFEQIKESDRQRLINS